MKSTKIAVLFFSRSAKAEAGVKSWNSLNSYKHNLRVATFLKERTEKILAKTGLPIFHYDEKLQTGDTLGEKLANANAEVFSKGYDAVISVGNDSPELHTVDWCKIIAELQDGHCVVGPSRREGAYLLGIQKSAFECTAFSRLSWQSDALRKSLRQYFIESNHRVFTLESLHDINTMTDLQDLIASSDYQLGIQLEKILFKTKEVLFSISSDPVSFLDTYRYGMRAPPVIAA